MGTVIVAEEFRRRKRLELTSRSAKTYKLPKRPILAKQIWICPDPECGEENDGDKCWNCGKDKPLG